MVSLHLIFSLHVLWPLVELIQFVNTFYSEWSLAQRSSTILSAQSCGSTESPTLTWSPPSADKTKCNFDAAIPAHG